MLEKIPLIPTRKSIGERWLGKALNRRRGDADVLGFVVGNDGWEFVPCDIESDGDEQWFIPVDGSKRYPANGVSPEPTRLYGCPVAIGYKDFGAVSETTNSEIARDVIVDFRPDALTDIQVAEVKEYIAESVSEQPDADAEDSDGDDGDADCIDVDESEVTVDVDEHTVEVTQPVDLASSTRADLEDDIAAEYGLDAAAVLVTTTSDDESRLPSLKLRSRLASWWHGVQWSKGWGWTQGGADTLVLEQDGDSALVLERADYQAGSEEPEWYVCRSSGYRYDARGHGAPPSEAGPADLAVAFAAIPKLLAPSVCRVARNMHEGKVEMQSYQYGGNLLDSNGNEIATDGGTNGIPQPKTATTSEMDLEVEERAFVSPEDVKLLGGAQETQDKIETLLKQVEAKENTPGGALAKNLLDYGKIVVAFILGAVLAGGGGGGGGGMPSVPMMIDVSPAMEVMALVL
jgi:hypothetical protein